MLTIVIPTHNRPTFLKRTIDYLNNNARGASVVISDSSRDSLFSINSSFLKTSASNLNVTHYNYRNYNYYEKIISTLHSIKTPFIVFCSDSSYLDFEHALQCSYFLSQNTDYSHAHGSIYTFKLDDKNTITDFRDYPQIGNESQLAERMLTHFTNYCNNYYAVHRTETILRNILEVNALNIGFTLKELVLSALAVYEGKRKMLDGTFLLRQKGQTGWDEEGNRSLPDNPLEANYLDTVSYGYPVYKEFLISKLNKIKNIGYAQKEQIVRAIEQDYVNWQKRAENYIKFEQNTRGKSLKTSHIEPHRPPIPAEKIIAELDVRQKCIVSTDTYGNTAGLSKENVRNKKIMTESDLSYELIDRYYNRKSITESLDIHITSFHGVLLDVGCGQMPYREYILNKNPKVKKYIGLDFAKGIYADLKQPDVTWDGQLIPLDDSSVDCAMATEVFEHLPNLTQTLTEIYRVLMPGGLLFFTVPFLWPLHDMPNDEYRYTPSSLMRHLKQAGFVDIDIAASGGWDASLAQMIGLWLKRRPMDEATRQGFIDLLFPFYQDLLRQEAETPTLTYSDMCNRNIMITGLYGTACKKRVSKNTYNKAECLET